MLLNVLQNVKKPKKNSSIMEKSQHETSTNDVSSVSDTNNTPCQDVSNVSDKMNPTEKQDSNLEYSLGSIAWARIGQYPYWPCIVTLDPDSNICHQKIGKNFIF